MTIACRSDLQGAPETQVKGDSTLKWGVGFAPLIPCHSPATLPQVQLVLRSLFFLAVNATLLKGGRARFTCLGAKALVVAGGGFNLLRKRNGSSREASWVITFLDTAIAQRVAQLQPRTHQPQNPLLGSSCASHASLPVPSCSKSSNVNPIHLRHSQ